MARWAIENGAALGIGDICWCQDYDERWYEGPMVEEAKKLLDFLHTEIQKPENRRQECCCTCGRMGDKEYGNVVSSDESDEHDSDANGGDSDGSDNEQDDGQL